MHKRLLGILALFWLLAACGGGGSAGSGAPDYVGATTQATVSAANARRLSVDAYAGSQISYSVSGLEKGVAGAAGEPALVQEICGIVDSSVSAASEKSAAKAAAAATTIRDTIYGFRGFYSYELRMEGSTISGTITFSHYQQISGSVTLTGTLRISGPAGSYPGTGDAGSLDPLTIGFENVTGNLDSQSLTLNGSMTYTQGISKTVTMSMLLVDNVAQRSYWLKDYSLVLAGNGLTMAGSYYHPVHGFVVMSTLAPLTVSAMDAWPTAGQLLFSGSNGTRARLTFTSTGYSVEVDMGGGFFPAP